jgi:protein-disulfide isomerase
MMNKTIKLALLIGFLWFSNATATAADFKSYPIDHMLGSETAPVMIIEYASLTCPHCAHFHETILPQIKKEWIDTGKAKFIFRDLPTPPIGAALAGAMLTQCSGEKRYFQMVNLLFKSQKTWVLADDPQTELIRLAGLSGMTKQQAETCLKRGDLLTELKIRSEEGGKTYAINSTPSFVVNGKLTSDMYSYETFKAVLEKAYNESKK